MSTSTKPRSRWSLTSFTLILTTEARVATDPRVARVSLAARQRMRGATAVLKVTDDALMAAMFSVLCGTKVEVGTSSGWINPQENREAHIDPRGRHRDTCSQANVIGVRRV